MVEKEAHPDFIKWFSELSNKDIAIAGGKGASLSEMYNAKIPVPAGFAITAQAYAYFLKKTGLDKKLEKILEDLDVENTEELNKKTKEIRKTIEAETLPEEIVEEILEAYELLNSEETEVEATKLIETPEEEPFVAVRSSATAEDLVDASFAGQQESFLNVRGKEKLIEITKKCMSSLFTPRATFYREKKGFKHLETYLSVIVQKMVNSKKSGVMFSKNPTKDNDTIVIEAVWGLGEGIVSGKIKPDHYVVEKNPDNFKLLESQISDKKIAIVKNENGENETIKLNDELRKKQVLTNYEIKRLAQYGKQLEEHYGKPQDVEFAIEEENKIFIVQSRPITTSFKKSEGKIEGEAILSGLGASPGVSSGPVKIIKEMKDLEKIQKGDIMVTEMTNPDMVVAMQKSAGIITDEGGVTSHAAIVSREMGIPAVVGTNDATSKLKEQDIVTVDGSNGKIYAGKGETKLVEIKPIIEGTKIKIKVIADLPEGAKRAAKSNSKSIGLTRLEGIIAIGGKHPIGFVKDNEIPKYIELIFSKLKEIVEPYEEIWIRSSDIRTDEYSNLIGAPKETEANPMMGEHGIRFSLKHKDIMKAELTAVKKIAEEFPNKKIGLMIPLLIRVEELQKTKELAKETNLPANVKLGVMIETPAAVQIIEELCQEGIDFISFGTNDLTQFTLALDRNNEEVQNLFDETHPAVVRSIQKVIKVCKEHNVETSICGQAGSRPEMAKILAEAGIDSISVNADAARKISEVVAEIEGIKPQENPTQVTETNQQINPPTEINDKIPQVETPRAETPQNPVEQIENKNIETAEVYKDEDIENVVLKALDDDPHYSPDSPKPQTPKNPIQNLSEEEYEQKLEKEWRGENN